MDSTPSAGPTRAGRSNRLWPTVTTYASGSDEIRRRRSAVLLAG